MHNRLWLRGPGKDHRAAFLLEDAIQAARGLLLPVAPCDEAVIVDLTLEAELFLHRDGQAVEWAGRSRKIVQVPCHGDSARVQEFRDTVYLKNGSNALLFQKEVQIKALIKTLFLFLTHSVLCQRRPGQESFDDRLARKLLVCHFPH